MPTLTMPTRVDIIAIIADFVHKLAPDSDPAAIGDDTDLMTLIDSYSFLDLLLHLEERVGTSLDLSDKDPILFVRVGPLADAVLETLRGQAA